MRKPFVFCFFLLTTIAVFAQRPKIKYGDVKVEDLKQSVYAIDSNANAIVLYDFGKVKYEGNNQGYFNVVYKFHKRVKLINKNSFDIATVHIPLYVGTSQVEEKIEKLEAATYNLENGNVVVSKIDKSAIFKDKVSKGFVEYKFTMPNIKEGSIIEYSYTLASPFPQDLRTWYFQGLNPVLWSEYDIEVPSIYNYLPYRNGYQPFVIDTISKSRETYNILLTGSATERSEVVSLPTETYHSIWAMKDIPSLKLEGFTTTLRNHIAKVEFHLASLRYPERPEKFILRSWIQVAEDLLKDERFGAELDAKNNWMNDDVNKALQGASTSYDKAKKIFEHVRDNFTCKSHDAIRIAYESSLKKVFQAKTGNVAEINLLLTAMLRNKGFDAAPVMLSTKDNGYSYMEYPLLDQLNYVICHLKIDSTVYLLDASEKVGFGKLPEDCYNGNGRLIAPVPTLVNLSPESIVESKVTSVFIVKGDKGKVLGSFSTNLGYYESQDMREKLRKITNEDFFKQVKKEYAMETDISNGTVENLKELDETVTMKYDFKFDTNDEDVIYFNPMMAEAYKTNPFKSVQRHYPVEMPYPTNETYVLNMEVPEGYKVDELPKSVRVKYNEDEGKFEYIITHKDGIIQMRCSIVLTKAIYMPEEYENLRSFYAYIVKKQGEQVVFKKIK